MVFGAIAQLAAAWQMVRPLTPEAWTWLLVPAITLLSNASLQDLRDIEGDRMNRRRTMPIVFGEWPTRIFVAIAFILLAVLSHIALFVPTGLSAGTLLLDVLLAALCVVIGGRVLLLRNPLCRSRLVHDVHVLVLLRASCGNCGVVIPLCIYYQDQEKGIAPSRSLCTSSGSI